MARMTYPTKASTEPWYGVAKGYRKIFCKVLISLSEKEISTLGYPKNRGRSALVSCSFSCYSSNFMLLVFKSSHVFILLKITMNKRKYNCNHNGIKKDWLLLYKHTYKAAISIIKN